MKLSDGQLAILDANGPLLVTGGPGSGKTTVSILKAAQEVQHHLRPGQKVLFLSFARATVSRVLEAIRQESDISPQIQKQIVVDTYHSFFWRLLETHGYLIGLPRKLTVLTPPAEAIALSAIRTQFQTRKLTAEQRAARAEAERAERIRLAMEEGRVCFDLYAEHAGEILTRSARIRAIVGLTYPVIVLDEFQDTNAQQWRAVEALGEHCKLVALADPEQRIFDWIGADPARLDQFRGAFKPTEVDLQGANHRSAGTDIALFANEVLTGAFTKTEYSGMSFGTFPSFKHLAMTKLVTTVYAARERLTKQCADDWSLAVLVPTRGMARGVSDVLWQPPAEMKAVPHSATIDMAGAILAAEVLAHLLQPSSASDHAEKLIVLMSGYYDGRSGEAPKQGDLKESLSIRKGYKDLLELQAQGKPPRANSTALRTLETYAAICALNFTGDPKQDWRSLRTALESGSCPRLREVADDVKNVRLLERGTVLRQGLAQDWRDNGSYANALTIVQRAFVQEHFSRASKPETGVVVMNMHKAKGKQFDEVIIFEGWPIRKGNDVVGNLDRIVRWNRPENADDQARQNLRVSITRGKRRTTILTPADDICVLLKRQG